MSRTTLALVAAGVMVGAMFVYLFVQVGSAQSVSAVATVSPPVKVVRPAASTEETPAVPAVVIKSRPARVPPKPIASPPVSAQPASSYVPPPAAPRIAPESLPPPKDAYVAPENPNPEQLQEIGDESDLAFRESRYEESLELALKALESDPNRSSLLRLAVASGCNLGKADVVEQYSAQLPPSELAKISKGCARSGFTLIPDEKSKSALNPVR